MVLKPCPEELERLVSEQARLEATVAGDEAIAQLVPHMNEAARLFKEATKALNEAIKVLEYRRDALDGVEVEAYRLTLALKAAAETSDSARRAIHFAASEQPFSEKMRHKG